MQSWVQCCAATGAMAQQPSGAPIRLGMIDGLSGPFANAGEAVVRNLRIAVERVNARGGVKLPDGAHPLELVTFDSKGNVDESLIQFRSVVDKRIPFVLQGNSSAVASALVAAINRQNQRQPDARGLGLGQHRHGRGGGMDAAATLCLRHALHTMHTRLEFHMREHATPGNRRDDFLEAAHLAVAD